MGMDELREMREKLGRDEAKNGNSGAIPNTPKHILLDGSEIEAKNPEHSIRFVNTSDPSKVARRIRQGYEKVPESEGGKTVGNLAAFRIRKEDKARLDAQLKKLNEDRLNAHVREMEQMAESEARRLHDRHGINVRAEDLLSRG